MLEGKLTMQKVPYDKLIRHQKYLIVHHLHFYALEVWHREYVGIFQHYCVNNNVLFHIIQSYDHVEQIQPHIGLKMWAPNTITLYEMVPQGQQSMEKRSLSMILKNIIDEHY